MTYEEEILAKHSTDRLRRNLLPRQAKKLNMEFDPQYNKMTKVERDEFLDNLYPEEKEVSNERSNADVRRSDSAVGEAAKEAAAKTDAPEAKS